MTDSPWVYADDLRTAITGIFEQGWTNVGVDARMWILRTIMDSAFFRFDERTDVHAPDAISLVTLVCRLALSLGQMDNGILEPLEMLIGKVVGDSNDREAAEAEIVPLRRMLWMEVRLTSLAVVGDIQEQDIGQLLADVQELVVVNYHRALAILASERIAARIFAWNNLRKALANGWMVEPPNLDWFIDNAHIWDEEEVPFDWKQIADFKIVEVFGCDEEEADVADEGSES
jgi:hypothetical protein